MGDDLLGMFLQARDEDTGQPMSDRQIRDEVMTMLIAGHETVASALTWTWLLLARHPQEGDLLQAEVRTVLGERLPISADLPALVRTGWVFSEALRLYPPAWVISRKAVQPDQVLGYDLPQGALVIISPYVVHRQAEFWPDPEAFQPERFSPRPSPPFCLHPFRRRPAPVHRQPHSPRSRRSSSWRRSSSVTAGPGRPAAGRGRAGHASPARRAAHAHSPVEGLIRLLITQVNPLYHFDNQCLRLYNEKQGEKHEYSRINPEF